MEGELEMLRVSVFNLRRRWRPHRAVLKGSMLHLSQAKAAQERLKVLPMAGAAIKRKDISRPADAWRNPFVLVLPPLAEGSRGIKKYTLSAATAELQASWISALTTASQSPAERQIAAYSKGRRLSRSLSRLASAVFRPLQLGIGALSPGERSTSQEVPAEAERASDAAGMQCWALPTATSTQQFAGPTEKPSDHAETSDSYEAAAPVAARHSDQQQIPDAAASLRNADKMKANDNANGRSASDRSHSAAADGTSKVTYPQLDAQTASSGNGQMLGKPDPAAQQPNTTQLLNQRVQEWDEERSRQLAVAHAACA